ncbi:hypothetical protein MPSEU_001002800 [Mayamaea pseudoterrestris]|nr:hypothetical protein MPSEU_001002800 [Mayamaea pseudoterrestris]
MLSLSSDHMPTSGSSRSTSINFDDPAIRSLPRILLMGPRRSGKTSIQRVVFQKMSPHETLFRLEPTQQTTQSLIDHTPLCRFTLVDFPGDDYADNDEASNAENISEDETPIDSDRSIFSGSTALVFVVDAQDEPYDHVLPAITSAVTRAVRVHPNIHIEIFLHKVDGELFLSDDAKYDCRRDVMTQVSDELLEAGVSLDGIHIRYHLTSIYDHSIYEALSRVVQRLMAPLPTLENLLNVLVSTCCMEKAFLFDVVSKLYISTDSGPVDMQSVELCSDMIDVVLDVSGIYGLGGRDQRQQSQDGGDEGVNVDSAYDTSSASVIRLSNGMVLYLKEVDTMLALVCITRSENFAKKSLINYNISCLKKALRALAQPASPAAYETNGPLSAKSPK